MQESFSKTRYQIARGCVLSHTAGECANKSTISSAHYVPDCMIYYLKSGKGRIMIGARTYDMKSGDVAIVNPTELYVCEIDDNVYHERLILHVDHGITENFKEIGGDILSPLYERQGDEGNFLSAESSAAMGLPQLFEKIHYYSPLLSPH